MPRLPWVLVIVGVLLLAIWQPTILLPLLFPGVLMLPVAQFLPGFIANEVFDRESMDGAVWFVALTSFLFWAALATLIVWFRRRKGRRPVVSDDSPYSQGQASGGSRYDDADPDLDGDV